MRKILFFLLSMTLVACSESLEDIEKRAGQTAVEYYRLLQKQRYADFVSGMYGADSIPQNYRQQMEDNAAMFMSEQNKAHKGIADITLSRCKADTARHTAEAYITIHYADSVKEVVCVPLVMRNDTWYMK